MNLPKETAELLEAYFAGDTSPEVADAMQAWLREDKANPRLLAEYGLIDRLISHEQKNQDASAIFASLLEAEASATPVVLDTKPALMHDLDDDKDNVVTISKAVSVLSYAAAQALRKRAVAVASLAAAIMIAAVLAMVFFNGSTPTPLESETPFADNTPSEPGRAGPVLSTPVATLTASHNAVWSGGPASAGLGIGDNLHPNQTLTLTQGFAEITTNDGAIAILEAPTTVELINSNNALRLHTGKLVGICETESSKGFLVRTPHMDITDLGTRFGVDASQAGATEVHVFDGEVESARHSHSSIAANKTRVVAGQAVRAESATDGFVAIDYDRVAFASMDPYRDAIASRSAREAGIAAMSGDIAWSPASAYMHADQTRWPFDDRAFVFEELNAYRLAADLPVTLIDPGTTDDLGETLPNHAIPAGTTIRSYLVILYPHSHNQGAKPQGSITFAGEVLGIATQASQSGALATMVGDQARLAPIGLIQHEWIDLNRPRNVRDVVTLQNDRRTIDFALAGSQGGTDAIRVFVRVTE